MVWTAKMCCHRFLNIVVFDVITMSIETNVKRIFCFTYIL